MSVDRSSGIDFDDCDQCADFEGSGTCSNCFGDEEGWCQECGGSRRCSYCDGTGRRPVGPDPEVVAEVERAGPLIPPDEDPS